MTDAAVGPPASRVDDLARFRGRAALHGVVVAPPVEAERSSRRTGMGRRHGRGRLPREGRLVIGRLEPWSVLKMAVLFNVSLAAIVVVAATVLWFAADTIGLVGNLEAFGEDLGFVDFRLEPATMLRAVGAMAGIWAVFGTFVAVIWSVLFNLITDVTGGMELTLRRGDAGR